MGGRWSWEDSDEGRLPEGMTRVGYDADTQIYTYKDHDGSYWEGDPGVRYGVLHRISKAHNTHQTVKTGSGSIARKELRFSIPSSVHSSVDAAPAGSTSQMPLLRSLSNGFARLRDMFGKVSSTSNEGEHKRDRKPQVRRHTKRRSHRPLPRREPNLEPNVSMRMACRHHASSLRLCTKSSTWCDCPGWMLQSRFLGLEPGERFSR